MIGWLLFGWVVLIGALVLSKIASGAPDPSDRKVARVSLLALLFVAVGASIGALLRAAGIA